MWVRDVPGWENGDPNKREEGRLSLWLFKVYFAFMLGVAALAVVGFVVWFVGMFFYLAFVRQ
jgi:hypothetical protein